MLKNTMQINIIIANYNIYFKNTVKCTQNR